MTQSRHYPGACKIPIMLTIMNFRAMGRIKEAQQSTTKPNLPKDGDRQPQVLASYEKPRNDPSKDTEPPSLNHENNNEQGRN
jgi:hypothetical protein